MMDFIVIKNMTLKYLNVIYCNRKMSKKEGYHALKLPVGVLGFTKWARMRSAFIEHHQEAIWDRFII